MTSVFKKEDSMEEGSMEEPKYKNPATKFIKTRLRENPLKIKKLIKSKTYNEYKFKIGNQEHLAEHREPKNASGYLKIYSKQKKTRTKKI